MINSISKSKFFNFTNTRYNYNKMFEKVDLNNYIIPKNLINERIGIFKGYKYPLVDDVIKSVTSDRVVPTDFSTGIKSGTQDLHLFYKFPHSIFNLQGISNGQPIEYVDLSFKGKYLLTPQGIPTFYDIPELTLYHMLAAGYIQYIIGIDNSISSNQDFYFKIAETYANLVSKVIDNMFPIISTSNTGFDKVYFMCMVFCMQNMFGVEKNKAVEVALKSKSILNKDSIRNECIYLQTNNDIMINCDYKLVFPIDNFCKAICDEYEFITEKVFNSNVLSWKFNDRMTKNAVFCLDSAQAFINMIYFAKNGLGLYNDIIIKNYLQAQNYDIVKEISLIVKGK